MKIATARALKSMASGRIVGRVIDRVVAVALLLASPPFLLFTKIGSARMPSSLAALRKIGLFPIRDHYYQPLFNDAHLTRPLDAPRELTGVDWRHAEQISLLGRLTYSEELIALDLATAPVDDLRFAFGNGTFESGDAEFLYAMIRHLKPNRVFEIGSGNSTKVVRLALQRNEVELGRTCEHVCIEPYEMPWLEELDVRLIRQRIEEVDLAVFGDLGPNDLLFIDSSHMIRPQGDVLVEFQQILPKLASGVYVHFHDIFSPRDYLDDWIRRDVRMWNEQYLLEVLLAHSDRYEVVAALNHLQHSEYEKLAVICPYLSRDREPGSFYLRVR